MRCLAKAVTVIIAVLSATALRAMENADSVVLRPIDASVTFEAGSVKNLDTYLSPIQYKGSHIAIGFESMRAMKASPEKLLSQFNASISYDKTQNPVGNNTMHTLLADFGWAMQRRWRDVIIPGLNLYGGGRIGFEGGVTYNPRNSNNVCSPQIYINAGITGIASYRFKIGKLPITARYQPSIPVVGCFYLPDYDQTFYEIYLGNYGNTVNFGWWKNRFDIDNLVTADLHIGSASLRLGYRNEFTTIWENNISVRRCVHSFVIGIAWESLRINLRSGIPQKAKIISALY